MTVKTFEWKFRHAAQQGGISRTAAVSRHCSATLTYSVKSVYESKEELSEFNIVVCLNFSVAVDIGSGEVRRVKSDNAENMSALCDIIRGVDLAVAVHIAVNNHDEFVGNVAFRIIQRIHIARRHITGGFLFTFCVQ